MNETTLYLVKELSHATYETTAIPRMVCTSKKDAEFYAWKYEQNNKIKTMSVCYLISARSSFVVEEIKLLGSPIQDKTYAKFLVERQQKIQATINEKKELSEKYAMEEEKLKIELKQYE